MGLLLALWLPVSVQAQIPSADPQSVPLNAKGEQRYEDLIHQLRCLVCQNQSIADSNAPLAADLRLQVRQRIANGASDDAIEDYLTNRYGEFVLYRPRFRAGTLILWLGPFALALAGVIAVWLYTRRSRSRAATSGVAGVATDSTDALQRLLEDEKP